MERESKVSILLPLSAIILFAGASWAAISITADGDWFETINEFDLTGGPGSDLKGTYESAADQVVINITGTTGDSDNWRVDVRKVNTTWHPDLHLNVQRTADGSGSGSISGGESYQEATDTYQSFFSGAGDRTGVWIQLMLTGVSVQVGAANYSTTVYYTIIDTD